MTSRNTVNTAIYHDNVPTLGLDSHLIHSVDVLDLFYGLVKQLGLGRLTYDEQTLTALRLIEAAIS